YIFALFKAAVKFFGAYFCFFHSSRSPPAGPGEAILFEGRRPGKLQSPSNGPPAILKVAFHLQVLWS
ncbi:MAG: hypothetical protein LBP33_08125, partial [Candidatus Adiutrix sp.]|nr:hypothetical protein [Candidatus Adiutrix sp.]